MFYMRSPARAQEYLKQLRAEEYAKGRDPNIDLRHGDPTHGGLTSGEKVSTAIPQ